jgi:hypothetical protein
MNTLIKKQLESVRKVDLPPYDENTLTLFIPRQVHKTIDIELNKCYLIELEDYIVNPFKDFTLHDNWNSGIPPKHKYLKCEIEKIMGKMVKINSIGFDHINNVDTEDLWEGWLPRKGFKILKEV